MRGLATLLTDTLGVNFTTPDPWQEIQVDPRRFDLERLREQGPELMVPVGLALRG